MQFTHPCDLQAQHKIHEAPPTHHAETNLWCRAKENINYYLGCLRHKANDYSMRTPPPIQIKRISDSEADFLIQKIYRNSRLSSYELSLIEEIPFDSMHSPRELVHSLSKKVQQHSRNLYESHFKSGSNENIDAEMDEYNTLLIALGKIQCKFIERDYRNSHLVNHSAYIAPIVHKLPAHKKLD
jgi:hypothetical protein